MPHLALVLLPTLLLGAGLDEASKRETIEVKARLVEIPGKPPPNDLYDYAYVMKYLVQGGALDGRTLYVAHFNPRQARDEIKDEMKQWVGGTLPRFKVGDMHRLTLTPHLEKIWKNAIEDHYDANAKEPRYWCLKVDLAK